MRFKHRVDDHALAGMSVAVAEEAARERLDWMEDAKRRYGGLVEAAAAEPDDVSRAHGEMVLLDSHLRALKGIGSGGSGRRGTLTQMIHPTTPGGYSSARRSMSAPAGWRKGHWSDPFLRQMKDLTPSGSISVPSLTGGIVPIPDRPMRLLDAIPVAQTLAAPTSTPI
jgi:hypothetical protein